MSANPDEIFPPRGNLQTGGQRVGPKKVSHTHREIARWLLENPEKPQSLCALHFGYTQAWLSCIINSNAFRDLMASLQEGADMAVIVDIPARLRGIAETTLEGIGQQVDLALRDGNSIAHREYLHQTAELTLKALGYGAPKAAPAPSNVFMQQNNFGVQNPAVAPEVLAGARERLLAAPLPHEVVDAQEVVDEVQKTGELLPSGPSQERPPFR